jgi:polyisoprenoid-binding protein YceI
LSSATTLIPYYTPGSWAIDPLVSHMRFSVRHLGIHHAAGTMAISGDVVVAADPVDSTVDATIDLGSVDTGNAGRDNAIRSTPLLDVDNRPTATYRSAGLRIDSGANGNAQTFVMTGELTLLGVRRIVPMRIDVEFLPGPDRRRFIVQGRGRFNRHDFGLRYRVGPKILDYTIASMVDVEVRIESERTMGPE